MSNKRLFLLLILAGAPTVIGQTPAKEQKVVAKPVSDQSSIPTPPMPEPSGMPKQISGGVLNGKAVSLPKPAYPAAARAVNAEGAVTVQVLIDEEGNVASANAISGHPLLRAAALEAARGARFSPTQLAGTPVKVSGVIVYNFVGSMTLGMFGYELGFAERRGIFSNGDARSLAARLPLGWSSEKETLEGLVFEAPAAPKVVEEPRPAAVIKGDANRYTIGGSFSGAVYSVGRLTPDSIQTIRQMQAAAESRLSSDPVARWNFNLGRGLGNLLAEIDDESKANVNISALEQLSASAPSDAPRTALDNLNKLIELAKASEPGPERRKEISEMAISIRNVRISQW